MEKIVLNKLFNLYCEKNGRRHYSIMPDGSIGWYDRRNMVKFANILRSGDRRKQFISLKRCN